MFSEGGCYRFVFVSLDRRGAFRPLAPRSRLGRADVANVVPHEHPHIVAPLESDSPLLAVGELGLLGLNRLRPFRGAEVVKRQFDQEVTQGRGHVKGPRQKLIPNLE